MGALLSEEQPNLFNATPRRAATKACVAKKRWLTALLPTMVELSHAGCEQGEDLDLDQLLDEFGGKGLDEMEIDALIRSELKRQSNIERNAKSLNTFERGDRIRESADRRAAREAKRAEMRADIAKRKMSMQEKQAAILAQ